MTIFSPTEQYIAQAADALRAGRLVGLPTETVYGLAGDATNDAAVAAIYAAKGRPKFNPLIVHVPNLVELEKQVVMSRFAYHLAESFWPGPLTLVLPRKKKATLSLLVSAGLDSVAVRMPSHPVAQSVLHAAKLPLAAPSANRSGRISPTRAAHVQEELGELLDMILDGGDCSVGLESTVIDVTSDVPVILRHGGIPREAFGHEVLELTQAAEGGPMPSPGMMLKHYAPGLPLRLNATHAKSGEAFIAFGPTPEKVTCNLSEQGNLEEAAANLFASLRACDDATRYQGIAVMPIPGIGLGVAINDRLQRAAER